MNYGTYLFFVISVLAALAGTYTTAKAATLQLSGFSKHSSPPAAGKWNEFNYGVGIKLREDEQWRYQFGYYRNSLNKDTLYGIVEYVPLKVGPARAGAFAGLATGYRVPIVAGLLAEVPITKRVTVTARVIPAVSRVTPAVIAIETGVKF